MISSWYAAEGLTFVVLFAMIWVAFVLGRLWDRTSIAGRLAEYVARADARVEAERVN